MKAIEFKFEAPRIELSEAEILADLRYPASASPTIRRSTRRTESRPRRSA